MLTFFISIELIINTLLAVHIRKGLYFSGFSAAFASSRVFSCGSGNAFIMNKIAENTGDSNWRQGGALGGWFSRLTL